MRTVKQIRKFTSIIILLFSLLLAPLWADTASDAVWAARINAADLPTLQALGALYGIPEDLQAQELRSELLSLRELTESVKPSTEVLLSITHADEIIQHGDSLFLLRGAVSLILDDQILLADTITVDQALTLLIAEGNVYFKDDDQELRATRLLLHYEDGALQIADSLMEEANPIDLEVTLLLRSALGYSNPMGTYQHYRHGVLALTASDPLSSIRAKEVLVREGGDLFFKGATLYIGRVPMLYLPFVPVLRNQMVGNPTMGFSSDRGMFASTTWELLGRNVDLSLSESALFALTDEVERYPQAILYDGVRPATKLQKWAQRSDSYLALFGDVSEHLGLSMGIESTLNFFDQRLQADLVSAIGYNGTKESFGYLLEPSLRYRDKVLQLSLELPIYSSPDIKERYLNRITAFNMLEALGKAAEFPDDVSSNITSYDWSLRGSFTFPTKRTTPYLSSFTITSFRATLPFRYNRSEKIYEKQDPTLASFRARARGTLFSFKRTLAVKPQPTKEEAPKATLSVAFDPLLPTYYKTEDRVRSQAPRRSAAYQEVTLSYSAEERFTERRKAEAFDEIAYRSSYTQGSVRLAAIPHSRLFTLSEEIIAQLNIVEDPTKERFFTREWQLTSHLRAAVPIAGLEYTLKQRIHHHRTFVDALGSETQIQSFVFDKHQVSEHALSLVYPLYLPFGKVELGFKSTLWPLAVKMTPSLGYSVGGFSLLASASVVETDGVLELEAIRGTAKYTKERFLFSFSPSYTLTPLTKTGFSFNQELSYRLKNSSILFAQLLQYRGPTRTNDAARIEELRLSAESKQLLFTYRASGEIGSVKHESVQARVRIDEGGWSFYKNRMRFTYALDTSLYFHFFDPYASRLEAKLTLGFWIAEFLDLSFSIASQNTGLFRYYDSGGDFSFGLLWEDLMRSFDFFGDGRSNTQFTLSSIAFALEHDLGDWVLNCKYSGNIVLSNNQYQWVPTLSIYLSWKMMEELQREEHWTVENKQWVRSL